MATIQSNVQSVDAELSSIAASSQRADQITARIQTDLIDSGARITDTRVLDETDFAALQTPLPAALLSIEKSTSGTVTVGMYFGAMAIGHSPQNVQILTHTCGSFQLTPDRATTQLKDRACPHFSGYLDDGDQIDITTLPKESR
ncbi:hypothetical protein [Frondihabitans sp. VKM Ac-2883]|uniref:hypothetical protein n=1 Tax=Frondihabitans sp. VKM Ac-2883 TaxID=2783823 RepID=UPI00188C3479|nr:hypothetical protein [Frondihabitans sp. VKM Ac-2883]MBF4575509.1 hypothetical protein [Frondihabitans sp. VKM Ac-2883]